MSVQDRLSALSITLPAAATPLASYVPAVRTGNLVFVSGQLPTREGTLPWKGNVPSEVSADDACEAARVAVLNALAAAQSEIGDLDRVRRVVKVTGYVSSDAGFTEQPGVVNGASDLLIEIFGDAGKHSRVAVGVVELPRDAPVEIDLILEVAE